MRQLLLLCLILGAKASSCKLYGQCRQLLLARRWSCSQTSRDAAEAVCGISGKLFRALYGEAVLLERQRTSCQDDNSIISSEPSCEYAGPADIDYNCGRSLSLLSQRCQSLRKCCPQVLKCEQHQQPFSISIRTRQMGLAEEVKKCRQTLGPSVLQTTGDLLGFLASFESSNEMTKLLKDELSNISLSTDPLPMPSLAHAVVSWPRNKHRKHGTTFTKFSQQQKELREARELIDLIHDLKAEAKVERLESTTIRPKRIPFIRRPWNQNRKHTSRRKKRPTRTPIASKLIIIKRNRVGTISTTHKPLSATLLSVDEETGPRHGGLVTFARNALPLPPIAQEDPLVDFTEQGRLQSADVHDVHLEPLRALAPHSEAELLLSNWERLQREMAGAKSLWPSRQYGAMEFRRCSCSEACGAVRTDLKSKCKRYCETIRKKCDSSFKERLTVSCSDESSHIDTCCDRDFWTNFFIGSSFKWKRRYTTEFCKEQHSCSQKCQGTPFKISFDFRS